MSDRGKKTSSAIAIVAVIVIAIIIISFILLMQGETTTSGEYPDDMHNEALSCITDNTPYPIFTYDNSYKKELRIDALFSEGGVQSIAAAYSLYYNDPSQIIASEAHNHAAMNQSFGNDGLGADALNVIYSKLEDRLKMNLYASRNKISNITLRYFLIDSNEIPNRLEDYQEFYQKKNFNCEVH